MRTATAPFTLRRARTLEGALKILREEPGTVPIAGCTDVYVALEFGGTPGTGYLDLTPLASLRRITTSGERLVIGALAANTGSVSPAGDTLPGFAVADPDVVLAGEGGERRVPFNAFYTGYRASVRRPDELIVAVEVPPVIGKQWFRKVGTRAAQAISKVVFAGVRGLETKLALGSVAPTVLRLTRTELALNGGGGIGDALRALEGEIKPIDDLRSTAEYRRSVSANLVRQFWSETA